MDRIDTKYLVSADDAVRLLEDVRQDYHVLEIESQRIGTYTSVYFDTSDRQMFYSHVTGRLPRYKIRERFYSQNELTFVEVKQKNNKQRTSKKRMSTAECSGEANDWMPKQTPFHTDELTPSLIICFERITLIDNQKTERVTLDFNLQYRTPSGKTTPVFDQVAIVELKQNKRAESAIKRYLRSKNIRPGGVSKYCTGILLTRSETDFKQYKPKISQFIKTQNIA